MRRTKTNNIPVYLDYKNGKTRTLTIVRKIEGDVQVRFTLIIIMVLVILHRLWRKSYVKWLKKKKY